ncbi:unnamed protein product [Thelazia callipaeda]|uniref:DLH domain-containing protein n=1 Tax=Thelazia callipaeda TaxID=103827 RepID=A0A0N5CU76_THECL|nr:unnamed protein product [Thelazia callipaeda]
MLIERVELAFAQLKLHASGKLNPNKLGIIGYCFGGLAVLDAARANLAGLKAAVVFHGFLNAPRQKLKTKTAIQASVLVLHGYDDKSVASEIPKFESEMNARNTDWQLITYSHTDHAFTVPGQPRYRKKSADRAWNATVLFLAEKFL